jgi:transposase
MRSYSADLRGLFCRYLNEGMSSLAAGRVVGVSANTVAKWAQRRRATGSVAARKVGGGKPVLLEAEPDWLVMRIEQKKNLTLHELLAELRKERGVVVCCDTLWRFLKRCGKTFKKTFFAKEQDRPDVVCRRKRWHWAQRWIDPRRMIFIDDPKGSTAKPGPRPT